MRKCTHEINLLCIYESIYNIYAQHITEVFYIFFAMAEHYNRGFTVNKFIFNWSFRFWFGTFNSVNATLDLEQLIFLWFLLKGK
jgi:hypothetical protein